MASRLVVVLDADVFVPILSCDLWLSAFEHDQYQPVVTPRPARTMTFGGTGHGSARLPDAAFVRTGRVGPSVACLRTPVRNTS